MSKGIGVTDEPRFYQAVYTAVLDAMREHHVARDVALRDALEHALHDLEATEGLYACDNNEGRDLFLLEHPSTKKARAALDVARDREATA